jgi:hypothetical protein
VSERSQGRHARGAAGRLACPTCPSCGRAPAMLLDAGRQALCEGLDCQVLTWNPTAPDGGLSRAQWIDVPQQNLRRP